MGLSNSSLSHNLGPLVQNPRNVEAHDKPRDLQTDTSSDHNAKADEEQSGSTAAEHAGLHQGLPNEPKGEQYGTTRKKAATLLQVLRGDFVHITERILFSLDPRTLLSCSLVCRDFNEILREFVWSCSSGERRITRNWINREPVRRKTELVNARTDMSYPASVHVNQDAMVVSIGGAVDLYDRRTFQHKQRLKNQEASREGGHSVKCLSSRYLVTANESFSNPELHLFAVLADFRWVPLKRRFSMQNVAYKSRYVRLAGDDVLVFDNTRNSVCGFRISEENYEPLWRVTMERSVLAVKNDIMVLGWKEQGIDNVHLRLHDARDGKLMRRRRFGADPADLMGAAADYAEPVCFVILNSSSQKSSCLCLYDMEQGYKLRQVNVSSKYPAINMWCSRSAGIVVMTAWNRVEQERCLLVWDMAKLLGNDDVSAPDRVLSPRQFASQDETKVHCISQIEVSHSKVVFVCASFSGRLSTRHVVEWDFWG